MHSGLVALGVVAAARLAMAGVLVDPPGRRRTVWGAAHILVAAASFIAAVSALGALTPALRFLPARMYFLQRVLAHAAFWLLGVFVVTTVLPPARRVMGLSERLFLAAVNGWLFLAALGVLLGR